MDVDADLTLDIDYTVADVGEPLGGTITLVTPLADQFKITLIDNVVISQEVPFSNQGAFFANRHESAFDKLTRLVNRVSSILNSNVLRLPETVQDVSPELPKPVANALFRYTADAKALETVLPEEIATTGLFLGLTTMITSKMALITLRVLPTY